MKGRVVMRGLKEEGRWKYYLDGKEVSAEEYDAAFPDKPMARAGKCSLVGWSKPILSDALAVHPKQIGQVMERNKKRGLHVEYETEYGRPILKSREERRKLMEISGVHDKQGGYGDDTKNKTTKEPDMDFSHLDKI